MSINYVAIAFNIKLFFINIYLWNFGRTALKIIQLSFVLKLIFMWNAHIQVVIFDIKVRKWQNHTTPSCNMGCACQFLKIRNEYLLLQLLVRMEVIVDVQINHRCTNIFFFTNFKTKRRIARSKNAEVELRGFTKIQRYLFSYENIPQPYNANMVNW